MTQNDSFRTIQQLGFSPDAADITKQPPPLQSLAVISGPFVHEDVLQRRLFEGRSGNMGICVAQLPKEELPFSDFSVSPLTTRVKPNGRIMQILDLSYPHIKKVELGMGIPVSVNKGINVERFKTEMSSTPLWLQSMRHGGPPYRRSPIQAILGERL